jgi:hypothetical protein
MSNNEVALEWNSSPIDDMVADSIAAIILHINQNPAFQHGISCSSCWLASLILFTSTGRKIQTCEGY